MLSQQQQLLLEIHRMPVNLGPQLRADDRLNFLPGYEQQLQLHRELIQQLNQRLLNHEFRRFQRVTKSPPPAEIATEWIGESVLALAVLRTLTSLL